jgi:hypothetical protein
MDYAKNPIRYTYNTQGEMVWLKTEQRREKGPSNRLTYRFVLDNLLKIRLIANKTLRVTFMGGMTSLYV